MTLCQVSIIRSWVAAVRESPSISSPTLSLLSRNDVISVTGKEEAYQDNMIGSIVFYEVEYEPSKFGWIHARAVMEVGDIMKSTIVEFCENKGIKQDMMDAFIAYVRSMNASKFMMRRDGDTVRLLVERMTEEQVHSAWVQFLSDFRHILPTASVNPAVRRSDV